MGVWMLTRMFIRRAWYGCIFKTYDFFWVFTACFHTAPYLSLQGMVKSKSTYPRNAYIVSSGARTITLLPTVAAIFPVCRGD